jgi:SAM-dependent methyltransferase
MSSNTEIWQSYYEKSLTRKHLPRTELALKLNRSNLNVAIDCGCGAGGDLAYLEQQGYQVHGFDINQDAIRICDARFSGNSSISISQATFENFDYPRSGVVIANSSLFFANPEKLHDIWHSIESSLLVGGVFAGDFMGTDDSWAVGYRSHTAPLSKQKVTDLFANFEIIDFHERNERAETTLKKIKQWHTFSVVAVKHT